MSKTTFSLSLWVRFCSPGIRLLVNSDGELHLPFGWFEIWSKLIFSSLIYYVSMLILKKIRMNDYKALKLFALDVFAAEESAFYDQTKQGNQQHPGANRVRAKIGDVMIPRKDWMYYDDHLALVQTPLGESLQDLQIRSAGERLDKLSIQSTIYQMLLALDYLHTECHLIHGGMKWFLTRIFLKDD